LAGDGIRSGRVRAVLREKVRGWPGDLLGLPRGHKVKT